MTAKPFTTLAFAIVGAVVLAGSGAPAQAANDSALLQNQFRAKTALAAALQARVRDCRKLAANDYGLRLRTTDDLLARWAYVYDAAAEDVVPVAEFGVRVTAKSRTASPIGVDDWVRASHLATRELHDICQRADLDARLIAVQREAGELQARLGGARRDNPAAPRLASETLHAIPPALRTP